MKAFTQLAGRLDSLAQRLDALSLRERGLIFGAGATLIYIACQTLFIGPLAARQQVASQRLSAAHRQLTELEQLGSAVAADPLVAAAARNTALAGRLSALDGQLRAAAKGYVTPEHMSDLLRQVLANQQGLTLVSLENLPVESLVGKEADELGPFVHPVDLVIDGDYASLVAYLKALEGLPWRLHWQRLELEAADYPVNRVHLVIGALSLSRDWISL